jgi:sugar O-acyltransferase (sialic acid O-acetyltransferase NeuD family)
VKELVLIGGGGHARACIDVIEQQGEYRVAGIVDVPSQLGQRIWDYEIIGTDDDLPGLAEQYRYFHIALGQIGAPGRRREIHDVLSTLGVCLPVLVSPLAYVSAHATLAAGTIAMHQAVVNAGATVGANCILNTRSLVEHDARVGDHCHIATNAVINGGVQVGSGSFVGSGAVIKHGVSIPAGSFIKAASLEVGS